MVMMLIMIFVIWFGRTKTFYDDVRHESDKMRTFSVATPIPLEAYAKNDNNRDGGHFRQTAKMCHTRSHRNTRNVFNKSGINQTGALPWTLPEITGSAANGPTQISGEQQRRCEWITGMATDFFCEIIVYSMSTAVSRCEWKLAQIRSLSTTTSISARAAAPRVMIKIEFFN